MTLPKQAAFFQNPSQAPETGHFNASINIVGSRF